MQVGEDRKEALEQAGSRCTHLRSRPRATNHLRPRGYSALVAAVLRRRTSSHTVALQPGYSSLGGDPLPTPSTRKPISRSLSWSRIAPVEDVRGPAHPFVHLLSST